LLLTDLDRISLPLSSSLEESNSNSAASISSLLFLEGIKENYSNLFADAYLVNKRAVMCSAYLDAATDLLV